MRGPWSAGRKVVVSAALLTLLAGIALLFAANGRAWVYAAASVELVATVILGGLAAFAKP